MEFENSCSFEKFFSEPQILLLFSSVRGTATKAEEMEIIVIVV